MRDLNDRPSYVENRSKYGIYNGLETRLVNMKDYTRDTRRKNKDEGGCYNNCPDAVPSLSIAVCIDEPTHDKSSYSVSNLTGQQNYPCIS